MDGKVFLKRNLDIKLIQEETTFGHVIKFKEEFNPLAADIVPVSEQRQSKDFELAQHLWYLLEENEDGTFGNIEVSGEIKFYKNPVERPRATETVLATSRLEMSLKGDFPWFLNSIKNESSCASFEVQLENVLAVTGESFKTITFSKLSQSFRQKLNSLPKILKDTNISNERSHLSYLDQTVEFPLNVDTWDFLFAPKAKGMKCPKLSLVVCANISEKMAQPQLIISPYGNGYALSPCQINIKIERRQEITEGKQPDALIIGQSGKEWQVHSKYLIQGSPVFQAMLENPGFEEGRTKRVNLSDLEDKDVDCLLQYLNSFNMDASLREVGMAVRMLEISERFQVTGLTKALETMLIRRKDIGPSDAIQLFSYVRRLDHFHLLKRKSLETLTIKLKEWKGSEEYKEWFRENPDLAWDLMTSSFENGFY